LVEAAEEIKDVVIEKAENEVAARRQHRSKQVEESIRI